MTIAIRGARNNKKNVITLFTEKRRNEIFVEENTELNPVLAKKISQELKEGQYRDNVFDITIELADEMLITSRNTIEEARAYAKGFRDAYHQIGITLEITDYL